MLYAKNNTTETLGGITALPRSEAALRYASLGWPVFPCWWPLEDGSCACGSVTCSSSGKHPLGKLTPQGVKEASTDSAVVAQWWQQYPEANVGLATGGELVVLDLDGPEALASIADREQQLGALPDTLEVGTGKGSHRYYSKPAGSAVRNTAGENGKRGLGPKLDTRADGGYVIAPPSLHPSGKAYSWQDTETQLAALPAGWLEFLTGTQKPEPRGELVALPERSSETSAYGQKALEGELSQLSSVGEGRRNHALNTASFALGQLVAGGEVEASAAERELQRAGLALGLPEAEVLDVVARGLADGQQQPRSAPENRSASASVSEFPTPTGESKTAPYEGLRETSDLGNAERLLDRYENRLRFCGALGGWQSWDGKRWRRDELTEARRLAGESARAILTEAGALEQDDPRKGKLVTWSVRSEHSSRIQAALWQAEALAGFATRAEDYDSEPLLLCVENGLLNLETLELGPHDRNKLITRLAPVVYDPEASCPTWLAFLERVLPDPELRAFAQRIAGLCLTGDRTAQAFYLLIGGGSNGKSTFVETLLALVGEYGATTPSQTLLAKRESSIPNDLARLRGARLVAAAESGQGKKLDESLIKQLTGGDRISARFMRGEWFEFEPEFSLLLSTNHAPRIDGRDGGIWRRVMVLPFEVEIPEAEQDKQLAAKLRGELSGVLLWAAQGYLDYVEAGRQLEPPSAVRAANAEYQQREDALGDFLSECLEGEGQRVTLGELYDAYARWCDSSRERALTKRLLTQQLLERGYEKRKAGSGWFWAGLALGETLTGQQQANF